jgi:hypothetical protein
MSMICICDGSRLFPRCDRNGDGKCTKKSESGYSTGKWSDDDDIHPTITPVFGPNR